MIDLLVSLESPRMEKLCELVKENDYVDTSVTKLIVERREILIKIEQLKIQYAGDMSKLKETLKSDRKKLIDEYFDNMEKRIKLDQHWEQVKKNHFEKLLQNSLSS